MLRARMDRANSIVSPSIKSARRFKMKITTLVLAGLALALAGGAQGALAAQASGDIAPPPRPGPPPRMPMSFFVTSVGLGKGGDLGGLAGADAHCQALAAATGSTKMWHAYLSTGARAGQPAVNARDRIGSGPWYNSKSGIIAANQNELHGDTLEAAQQGNGMWKLSILNEKGQIVRGEADNGNVHGILTGSTADGHAFSDTADHTCNNWTSSTTGAVQIGHSDRVGGGNISWNSSQELQGCSQESFGQAHSAGLFYCFATN
jgi:hypothetical protein